MIDVVHIFFPSHQQPPTTTTSIIFPSVRLHFKQSLKPTSYQTTLLHQPAHQQSTLAFDISLSQLFTPDRLFLCRLPHLSYLVSRISLTSTKKWAVEDTTKLKHSYQSTIDRDTTESLQQNNQQYQYSQRHQHLHHHHHHNHAAIYGDVYISRRR